jgi:hypothetical protein
MFVMKTIQRVPQEVIALSRKVDECQPLVTGHINGVPQYMPLSMLDATPSREIPQGSGLDPGSRLAFLPCAPTVFAPDGGEVQVDPGLTAT